MNSIAARIAALPEPDRQAVFAGMTADELAAVEYSWPFWARPDQLPPPGDWRTWLLLGGRGSGKTRSASEWVRAEVESFRRAQFGIIGPTSDSIRRIQIEGPSGILSVAPPSFRPSYEPSTRRVVWPNGAVAHLVSTEEVDRIRGLNLDAFWWDEITSSSNADAGWPLLQMALRIPGPKGDAPCGIVTTTPKPSKLLKEIIAAPSTVITRAKTSDNLAFLDSATVAYLQQRYGGSNLGRQELDAELLEEAEGALWTRAMIEENRVSTLGAMQRIVVAIDPAGGTGGGSTETGIIVAGIGHDKHCYIIADLSGKHSPESWARRAVDAFNLHSADRIVCEQNFGGSMVESTIRTVAPRAPVKMMHASRGKAVRAEPVVAFYEQHRVHHVGNFPALEDQLCQWEPNAGKASPDRLDALVWAITELALGDQPRPAYMVQMNIMGR